MHQPVRPSLRLIYLTLLILVPVIASAQTPPAIPSVPERVAVLDAAVRTLEEMVMQQNEVIAGLQQQLAEQEAALRQTDGRLVTVEASAFDLNHEFNQFTKNFFHLPIARLNQYLEVTRDELGNPLVTFAGVNLQLVDGSGASPTCRDDTSPNGLGNLVIGYNEQRSICGDPEDALRTGSHNLVIGPQHSYTGNGGLVAGAHNTIAGNFSTVTGGRLNKALAPFASVTGGEANSAEEYASTITGGSSNRTTAGVSSVSGGAWNNAAAVWSSISGGVSNVTRGYFGTVSGGASNSANGAFSAVGGGYGNTAALDHATVSGGYGNTAAGQGSSVSGGTGVTATGLTSWAAGGITWP